MTLPLRERRVDIFFAVVFAAFTVTSLISDLLPTIGVDFSRPSAKFLAFNLPYVLIPILLLIRMRKPMPFTRGF